MANINHPKKEPKKDTTMLVFLFFSIVFSLTLALRTVSPLEFDEHLSIERGVLLFLLGIFFFSSLFNFFNTIGMKTSYGTKLRKQYQLAAPDVLDISNKLVSMIQAVLSCLSGGIVCLSSCQRNFLRANHYASEGYAWFGCSYFLYDIWSMYRCHTCTPGGGGAGDGFVNGQSGKSRQLNGWVKFGMYLKQQPLMVGHHLFIGSFGFLVIVYLRGGLGDCVFGYCYLMELSTPFVSLRGILSRLGRKNTRLYVANGMLMLVTFFVCRIVMFPYLMHLYARSVSVSYVTAMLMLPLGCKISILILVLPQVYWFCLMLKGASQLMCVPKVHNAGAPANNNEGKGSGAINKPKKRRTINSHSVS